MNSPRNALKSVARATLIAGATGILIASTALAGKGGHVGTTSSTLHVPDGVYAGTTTATGATGSWVHAKCSQGGTLVYEQWVANSGGSATFNLGPTPSWTGGSASCMAESGSFSKSRFTPSASTTFNVSG